MKNYGERNLLRALGYKVVVIVVVGGGGVVVVTISTYNGSSRSMLSRWGLILSVVSLLKA